MPLELDFSRVREQDAPNPDNVKLSWLAISWWLDSSPAAASIGGEQGLSQESISDSEV